MASAATRRAWGTVLEAPLPTVRAARPAWPLPSSHLAACSERPLSPQGCCAWVACGGGSQSVSPLRARGHVLPGGEQPALLPARAWRRTAHAHVHLRPDRWERGPSKPAESPTHALSSGSTLACPQAPLPGRLGTHLVCTHLAVDAGTLFRGHTAGTGCPWSRSTLLGRASRGALLLPAVLATGDTRRPSSVPRTVPHVSCRTRRLAFLLPTFVPTPLSCVRPQPTPPRPPRPARTDSALLAPAARGSGNSHVPELAAPGCPGDRKALSWPRGAGAA